MPTLKKSRKAKRKAAVKRCPQGCVKKSSRKASRKKSRKASRKKSRKKKASRKRKSAKMKNKFRMRYNNEGLMYAMNLLGKKASGNEAWKHVYDRVHENAAQFLNKHNQFYINEQNADVWAIVGISNKRELTPLNNKMRHAMSPVKRELWWFPVGNPVTDKNKSTPTTRVVNQQIMCGNPQAGSRRFNKCKKRGRVKFRTTHIEREMM